MFDSFRRGLTLAALTAAIALVAGAGAGVAWSLGDPPALGAVAGLLTAIGCVSGAIAWVRAGNGS